MTQTKWPKTKTKAQETLLSKRKKKKRKINTYLESSISYKTLTHLSSKTLIFTDTVSSQISERNGSNPSESPLLRHTPPPNHSIKARSLHNHPPSSHPHHPLPLSQTTPRSSLLRRYPLHHRNPVHLNPMPREPLRQLGLLPTQLGLQLQRPPTHRNGPTLPRLRLRALAHRHGQAWRRRRHQTTNDRLLHPDTR